MSMPMRWDHAVAPEASGHSEAPLRRRRARKNRRPLRLMLAFVCCAIVGGTAVVGAQALFRAFQPVPALRLLKSETPGTSVALSSAGVERSVGFASVTGNVENRTAKPLVNVEAVVELLDAQNKTLRVESALLAFDPLPAGVSSPFRVELMDDSRAVAYRVRFKKLLGPSLD